MRSIDQVAVLTYHRTVSHGVPRNVLDIKFNRFVLQMQELAARTTAICNELIEIDGGRYVCLTFDDCTADHKAVADLLSHKGLSGIFFVVVERLGCDGYLDERQVSVMAEQGHYIGSHSMSHPKLPSLSKVELQKELFISRCVLQELSDQVVGWLAFPGGYYSQDCLDVAKAAGYSVMRTMDWGYASLPLEGLVDCLPVLSWYKEKEFRALLNGGAPLWQFRWKKRLKSLVGETLYFKLRNKVDQMHGSRS